MGITRGLDVVENKVPILYLWRDSKLGLRDVGVSILTYLLAKNKM